MNYSINAYIYETVSVHYSHLDKDGKPLEPKFETKLSKRKSFNIVVGDKDTTITGAELKAKIKESLSLPDGITEVTITGNNLKLEDDKAVAAYGIIYEATTPYVAPTKK